MKSFIVHNKQGKILRIGSCQDKTFHLQAGESEFIMKGTANDVTQKVIGLGQSRRVVDKTPEEILIDNPPLPAIPIEKQFANITNEQWQDILNRLSNLEKFIG